LIGWNKGSARRFHDFLRVDHRPAVGEGQKVFPGGEGLLQGDFNLVFAHGLDGFNVAKKHGTTSSNLSPAS